VTEALIRRVVENVKMRSHVQSTRYWVFALIDTLMAHHRDGESAEIRHLRRGFEAYDPIS
jgi:hypothetical protein